MDEVQFDFHDPKQKEMFLYLLKKGNLNVNKALMYAIEHGDLDIVKALVETGDCDLNHSIFSEYPFDCNCEQDNMYNYNVSLYSTPLFNCVMYDRQDILSYLLSMDLCNVNIQDKYELFTPLIVAVCENRIAIVKLLLATGLCDVNIQNEQGNTALHFALDKKNLKMIELLIATGKCDLSLKNKEYKLTVSDLVYSSKLPPWDFSFLYTKVDTSTKYKKLTREELIFHAKRLQIIEADSSEPDSS